MLVKLYKHPKKVGYLGWIESTTKRAIAFIKLDGEIVWDW